MLRATVPGVRCVRAGGVFQSPLPLIHKHYTRAVCVPRRLTCQPAAWLSSDGTPPSPSPSSPSSSPSSAAPDEPSSFTERFVKFSNATIANHPLEFGAAVVAVDIAGVVTCFAVLHTTGVVAPPEFALAFALSRPLRRVRLPLDLAAAAVVARVAPFLTRVRLSHLASLAADKASPASPPRAVTAAAQPSSISSGLRWWRASAAAAKASQLLDRYGLAYLVGSRSMGVAVVTGLYAGIVSGVDVAAFLDHYGLSAAGHLAGEWAGAVVLASAAYPVSLFAIPYVAQLLATARRGITGGGA